MSIRNLNLKKSGYSTITIPKKVREIIIDGIKHGIKTRFNSIYKKKNNLKSFSSIDKSIMKLKDNEFQNAFGNNLFRYLRPETTKEINKWITKIPGKFNSKMSSLHYPRTQDLKKFKNLSSDQFVGYFRCVRSNKNDVTYPHRDIDFWNLELKKNLFLSPFKQKKMFKVWIPISGCGVKNSLRLIKDSNKKKINIKYVLKNNNLKPKIPEEFIIKNNHLIVQPIKNFHKQGLIFDNKSVHFAPINNQKKTRISVEFTVFTK